MKGTFPTPEVIHDLTRPNFGDHDVEIAYTQKNIQDAEVNLESTLNASFTHA